MPEFKEDEDFKFPDEIDEKDDKSVEIEAQGDDVTIEIEDDTPPEDRNVEPLPEDMKQELETADEDDVPFPELLAKDAYIMADAMLKVRNT